MYWDTRECRPDLQFIAQGVPHFKCDKDEGNGNKNAFNRTQAKLSMQKISGNAADKHS